MRRGDYVDKSKIGKAAIVLSLTETREEEEELKKEYWSQGLMCTATGIGGESNSINQKINGAVTSACFNNTIITKDKKEVHAVIHATQEAKEGFLLHAPTGANVVLKAAVVRYEDWLAVAIYGYSAMHSITNHERAGLGIMHL